jgi:hypothetical protein
VERTRVGFEYDIGYIADESLPPTAVPRAPTAAQHLQNCRNVESRSAARYVRMNSMDRRPGTRENTTTTTTTTTTAAAAAPAATPTTTTNTATTTHWSRDMGFPLWVVLRSYFLPGGIIDPRFDLRRAAHVWTIGIGARSTGCANGIHRDRRSQNIGLGHSIDNSDNNKNTTTYGHREEFGRRQCEEVDGFEITSIGHRVS